MQKINTTTYITRTGILLALALIVQIGLNGLGSPVVGPLVNLVLIVAASLVGTLSGVFIGILTPLVALIGGIINPILAPQIPFIMAGNAILVLLFNLLKRRIASRGEIVGLIAGSMGKFAVLAFSIRVVAKLFLSNIPPQKLAVIMTTFSLPQLYHAIVGGVLALIVVRFLPKSSYINNSKNI